MIDTGPSPELRREFEAAFESIAQAFVTAAEERTVHPAKVIAESVGLKEQSDTLKTMIWERTEGGLTLWFRWHWYDQSHPFSIRPDMNTLRLELRQGPDVLQSAEKSYED